jgi:multidrug efflux pump subunit AcrB
VNRSWIGTLLAALAGRRVAMAALSVTLLILAGASLTRMPLQLLPEIRYPQVRIISDIPGQTSGVIEESVNEPIEAALGGVPGIVKIESRSGDGRSYIDLFFSPGYDLDRVLRDVTQAVQRAQAQIPAGFPDPRVFAVATTEEPALQFAFGSPELPVPEIRQRLRTTVLPRLRAVRGVEAVYLSREEIPELVLEVDPGAQMALGISLAQMESAILRATAPPAASAMRTPGFEGISVLGDSGWDPTRLSAHPIAGTVTLGDLARVHRDASEERVYTRLNGNPAVLVTVHRSTRAHATRVARESIQIVEDLVGAGALDGLEATLLFDDSVVTRSAVRSVVTAALGGAILAMLLLLLALRHRRHTPLVAAVVGVSLAASVVVLQGMGQSLNLLTLAGLLLSVGLGLDYAIIYFDRLDRLPAGLPDPHLKAMEEVAIPLLGALLTTLAAVLPFLWVQGMVALLFRPLIWTVAVAAVFSFLFAVLLLPVFTRVRPELNDGAEGGAASMAGAANLRPTRPDLTRRPMLTWAVVVGVVVAMGVTGRMLSFEVLPVVDDGFVEARLTHPAGISLEDLDVIARAGEDALGAIPGTEALFTTVGGYFRDGLPAFRPGQIDYTARLLLGSGGTPASNTWAQDARRALQGLGVPGLRVSVTPPRIRGVQTRLAEADLIVVLSPDDGNLVGLAEVETRVVEALRTVPGLTDGSRMRGGVSPRWLGEPDPTRLAQYEVTLDEMVRTLEYGLEGRVLRTRMQGGEPLQLRARYDRGQAGGGHQLAGLPVVAPGGMVPMGELARFRLVEEPTHIERREGRRVVRVSAGLTPDGPGPGVVGRNVEIALQQAGLPSNLQWWLEGDLEALAETRSTFTQAMVLALVLVLTLLIVQYGSVGLAAAGLVTIPLSGLGALLLLGVLGRPLDAMVLAGLLIAVGIVANNVILVLSEAQARVRAGVEAAEAAAEAGVTVEGALAVAARNRMRPITLTVLSTVLGMSPLLFGGSQVFGLLQPLAIALTGSLLISIPLAVILLPGVAAALVRLERRVGVGAGAG